MRSTVEALNLASPGGTAGRNWRFDATPLPHSDLAGAWDGYSMALEGQVQNTLNLHLQLKNPAQALELAKLLLDFRETAHTAVWDLRYIHFARFVFSPDYSSLWVITVYDGDFDAYLMDFVATLGDVFDGILMFIKDAPPLPVAENAREYVAFVKKNSIPGDAVSAYPDLPMLQIVRMARGLSG